MKSYRPDRLRGFTLIEMMISIAVSLLVLAAVLSVYLAGSRANQTMQQRVALQQDARFAMTGLTRELRMAGSFGCMLPDPAKKDELFKDRVASGSAQWMHYDPDTIGVYQQAASGSGWTSVGGFSAQGDVLVIQYGSGGVDASITTDASATAISNIGTTLSPDRPQIANAAVLALTNCKRLEMFANNGNLTGSAFSVSPSGGIPLPSDVGDNQWELMRLTTLAYAVGTYQGRQGLYLFELDEDGQWQGPKEIAAGVSGLTTQFGIQQCTPGTAADFKTQYFSAGDLSADDWKKIGLVRLKLDIERTGLSASGTEATLQRSYTTIVTLRRENLCLTQSAG